MLIAASFAEEHKPHLPGLARRIDQPAQQRYRRPIAGGDVVGAILGSLAAKLNAVHAEVDIADFERQCPLRDPISAHQAGGVDDTPVPRSVGVWRRADGRLIVHCGDPLLIGNERIAPGATIDGRFYVAATPIGRPPDEPATAEQCQDLKRLVGSWRFLHEGSARIVVGFIGIALLGAALDIRPHSSSAATLDQASHGSAPSWTRRSGTWCGIQTTRRKQGSDRKAPAEDAQLFSNEAEGTLSADRIKAIFELLRGSYSGEGALTVRGSPGGRGTRFPVIRSRGPLRGPAPAPQCRRRAPIRARRARRQAGRGRRRHPFSRPCFATRNGGTGVGAKVLRRLPNAARSGKAIRIGVINQRSVFIPAALLPVRPEEQPLPRSLFNRINGVTL